MRTLLRRVLTAVTASALAGAVVPVSAASAADAVTINLVVSNDFHGRIDENVVQWAATVSRLDRDPSAQGSLFLGAGDMVGASLPASSEQHDDPTLDLLNLLGMDAEGVGNHEFDRGYDDLTGHLMKRAQFPIVAANVVNSDGAPALNPSVILTTGGIRVGVIGAVTDTTPTLVATGRVAGLTFTDPVAAINRTVEQLKALPEGERPDVMVALVHEGAPYESWTPQSGDDPESAYARIIRDTAPDVAAIITGHTHKEYVLQAAVPGEPGRTRPVIQAGAHGEAVGLVSLTVQPDTGVVTSRARTVSRTTESDAALIAENPLMGDVAALRDRAVAFAAERIAAREQTQRDYDSAMVAAQEAKDALQAAEQNYAAAAAERDTAYQASSAIKRDLDALYAEGRQGYADAAEVKKTYDATLAEGRQGYADAAEAKKEYDALTATARDAWAEAATIKNQYDAAFAEARRAYDEAVTVKNEYDATLATGRKAYADAAAIQQVYDTALAESRAAYADAAALKEQYMAVLAAGPAGNQDQLADLAARYFTRLNDAQTAYARAVAQKDPYDAALLKARTAYARLDVLKQNYDAASAKMQSALGRAADMKAPYAAAIAKAQAAMSGRDVPKQRYDAALAVAQAAFGKLPQLKQSYDAAIARAQTAFNRAKDLQPSYEAAVAVVNAAVAKVVDRKKVYDLALAAWRESLSTLTLLKEKFLGLL